MLISKQQQRLSFILCSVASVIVAQIQITPNIDEDFGVDPIEQPIVDPGFGVDPPVDPGFGVDPIVDPGFGVDPIVGQCSSQSDCTNVDEYCSNGYCLPQGSCLNKYDCFSPHNSLSTATLGVKCVGHMDCNFDSGMGVCQIECTGVENSCPNNEIATDFEKNPVSLPDGTTGTPCEIRKCPGYNSDWCYNESCGDDGGKAVFVTTSGTADIVCTTCTGASSCDETKNEFCSGGVCIPYGQCNTSADCMNPANTVVSATTCIGFMDCFVGNCQQVCKDSGCPNNLQKVPYTTSVCSNMSRMCPQAVSCVVDDCGVLAPLFYDMDGNVVCPQGTPYDGYYLRK